MCGIFGAISREPVAEEIYQGLVNLQHRGQDSCGMYLYHPETGQTSYKKEKGLVKDVFGKDPFLQSDATWGIGHVRYTTAGTGNLEETQPMVLKGNPSIALAYNGNLVNYPSLKKELEEKEGPLLSHNDAEVMLKLFAGSQPRAASAINFDAICDGIKFLFKKIKGAYSSLILIEGKGLVAFRDPHGIKPLFYGFKRHSPYFAVASETEALKWIGCDFIEHVCPGEVLFLGEDLTMQKKIVTQKEKRVCSFEFAYFSKANTRFEGQEIYRARIQMGKALAKKVVKLGIEADVIIPIPDTGRPAAISCARELGVNFEEGFIKKEYSGRTFLLPSQKERQRGVSNKFSIIDSVFKDKNVILVDDSIVRGSVSTRVTYLARKAGAKKVYLASTFPPIRYPCFYGVDFPHREQLIAFERTPEEVAGLIEADDVIYLGQKEFKEALGLTHLCMACIDGNYPTAIEEKELVRLRKEHLELAEV